MDGDKMKSGNWQGEVTTTFLYANRESEILLRISRFISSTLDIENSYAEFASLVNELVQFDRIIIADVDLPRDVVTPVYVAGLQISGPGQGEERVLSSTPFDSVVKERQTLVLDGPGSDVALKQYPAEIYGKEAGFRSLIGTPLIANGEITGLLIIRSKAEQAYGPREAGLAEGVAAQIAGAIASSRLHARTRTEAREREILAELGGIISSSLEIDEVYDQFATQAHRLVAFDRIAISMVDSERKTISPVYVAGLQIAGWGIGSHHSIAGSEVEQAVRSGRIVRLKNRSLPDGLLSGIAAPLSVRDQVIGLMILNCFDPHAYTADHVRRIGLIAERVAPAIQNAMAYQQSREIAALEERNRIAREIHDSLAQNLTGIIWQLNSALADATDSSPVNVKHLEQIRELAKESLEQAKRSVFDLRSGPLNGRSLPEALQAECQRMTAETTTLTRFSREGKVRTLPTALATATFRISQEAMMNVRKHSFATECRVKLEFLPSRVELIVDDNGRGFDLLTAPSGDASGGFGLISMRERARLIGGQLFVESQAGEGTRIRCTFPVSE